MHEQINGLIDRFKDLHFPLADAQVDELLQSQSLIDTSSTASEFTPYLHVLKDIFKQLRALQSKKNQLDAMVQQKNILAEIKKLRARSSDIKVELSLKKQGLDLNYQQIEMQSVEERTAQDPLQAMVNVSNLDSQKNRVSAILESTKTELKSIAELSDRIKLKKQNEELQLLVRELKEYSVVASAYDSETLSQLINSVQTELDSLSKLRLSLNNCQGNLAYSLSSKNLPVHIQNLDQTLSNLAQELESVDQKISSSHLDEQRKEELLAIYEKAFDPGLFIGDLKQRRDSISSYLSPMAWLNWGIYNQDYHQRKGALESEIYFLERLEEKTHLLAKHRAALSSKQKLQQSSTTSMQLLQSEETLVKQTQSALSLFYQQYGLNPASPLNELSESDLLANTIQTISYIHDMIERRTHASEILHRLHELSQSMTRLRVKNTIIETSLQDANDASAYQDHQEAPLESELEEKKQSKILLNKKSQLCQEFLSAVSDYDELEQEFKTIQASISKLKRTKSQHPTTTKGANSHKIQQDMVEHQDKLLAAFKELIVLGPIQKISDDNDASSKPFEEYDDLLISTTPSELHFCESIFKPWTDKINGLLHKLPDDLQTWYLQLSEALESKRLSKNDELRAVQLLRDIYFECKHNQDRSQKVLYEYRLISENLSNILPLKPALKPGKEMLPDIMDSKLKKTIETLYEKSKKLQSIYPVEAKLLYQATQSMHHAALEAEKPHSEASKDYSFSLLDDPRYNPLKKHRGFLKLWESIERFFSHLISKNKEAPEQQARESFCFFTTRTVKLIKKAEQEINDLNSKHQSII